MRSWLCVRLSAFSRAQAQCDAWQAGVSQREKESGPARRRPAIVPSVATAAQVPTPPPQGALADVFCVALVGVGFALERDVAIRLLRAAVAAEAEQELRDP